MIGIWIMSANAHIIILVHIKLPLHSAVRYLRLDITHPGCPWLHANTMDAGTRRARATRG